MKEDSKENKEVEAPVTVLTEHNRNRFSLSPAQVLLVEIGRAHV